MPAFTEQIRRHSVALISLVVAISSLGYNTWRNEQSEANRNIRTAGIELLIKLGELDRIVLHAQYGDRDESDSSDEIFMFVRSGWAYVLTVRDLGSLVPDPVASSSAGLFRTWSDNVANLGQPDGAAASAISDGIDKVRGEVLGVLAELD